MKIRCLAFPIFILLVSATVVRADSVPVDPKMVVTDPPCVEGCGTALESTVFSFSSNANGGGFLTFQNVSDLNWTSLLIETGSVPFNVPADSVTCQTNAFLSCQVSDLAGGITAMFFSGTNGETVSGIPNLFKFTINLNDDINGNPVTATNGFGGWGANRTFNAAANVPAPVPEPATLTLMGVGIGALLASKKLRGRRQPRN